jgi:hypothetical protein
MSGLLAGHGAVDRGWWACERILDPPSPIMEQPTWLRSDCPACMRALRRWLLDQPDLWAMGVSFGRGPFYTGNPDGYGFVPARLLLGDGLDRVAITAIACPVLDEPPAQLIVSRQTLTVDAPKLPRR